MNQHNALTYTKKDEKSDKQRRIRQFQHTLKVHEHTLYGNQHTRNIHADELLRRQLKVKWHFTDSL